MALPVSNGKTVLITGINGYIASVLGQLLLTKGYSIRGTTRRSISSEPLLNGPYEPYKNRVKIYEIPDMTVDGAFDEAAKGVHGIFHTASPVNFGLDEYERTVIPAVKGTETLLTTALKSGPQLSSVVVTSSVVAIVNPTDVPGHVFTEEHYASVALDRANKERGGNVKTPGIVLYSASKTAADRAVWQFKKDHKPSFAISSVNPSVVIGPPVLLPAMGCQLNETLLPVYNILSGKANQIPDPIGSASYVDVRDVASIHLWVYENPVKTNGQRYIAAAGCGPPQGIADILRKKYKGTKIEGKITVGVPGEGYIGYNKETGEIPAVSYLPEHSRPSGQKAATEIGIKWISFVQSISDTADVLEALL